MNRSESAETRDPQNWAELIELCSEVKALAKDVFARAKIVVSAIREALACAPELEWAAYRAADRAMGTAKANEAEETFLKVQNVLAHEKAIGNEVAVLVALACKHTLPEGFKGTFDELLARLSLSESVCEIRPAMRGNIKTLHGKSAMFAAVLKRFFVSVNISLATTTETKSTGKEFTANKIVRVEFIPAKL